MIGKEGNVFFQQGLNYFHKQKTCFSQALLGSRYIVLDAHFKWAYMKKLVDDSNMAASKLEINFRRLLERCEAMAEEIQDNKENVNWRLEKVGSIDYKIIPVGPLKSCRIDWL